jgi:N-acetylglucosamine kinase-like BadF-type ATPase
MSHLVIDSGATKTEWVYFDGQEHHSIRTSGIHPYYLEQTPAFQELETSFSPFLTSVADYPIDTVCYFGTGCADEKSRELIRQRLYQLMMNLLPEGSSLSSSSSPISIQVESDITGAAKATFPDSEGVMVILGTGSIFARVNRGVITNQLPSLGYILGDEGSAAYFGKLIYNGFYRKIWSSETLAIIQERTGFHDYGKEMREFYSTPKSASHLGQISKHVFSQPIPEELEFVLKQEFLKAFRQAFQLFKDENDGKHFENRSVSERNLADVDQMNKLPIALSGGVIKAHEDLALECANLIFRGHSVKVYSSFAMPISIQLAKINSRPA